MPLINVRDLISIKGSAREHMQSLEDALRDVLLAKGLDASSLPEADLIARATITLLLTLAAREAMKAFDANRAEADLAGFGKLAADALAWAVHRDKSAPEILH